MLKHNVLKVAEIFVLVCSVVHASDNNGSSSCLRARLAFESKGINLFETSTNAVSASGGNTGVIFYLLATA